MQAKQILELAKKPGQASINQFNFDEETRAALKKTSMLQYLNIQRTYAQTHYGKYTLATAVLGVSGLYLGALFLAPTLIPFGLAVIATAWIKYTVAAITLAASLYSGAIFAKSTYNEAMNLKERFSENELSNYDVTLLASASIAGFSVVGMMYAFPTMLPFLGTLGTVSKAVTASVTGVASAVAGYAAFFGRPKPIATAGQAVLKEDEVVTQIKGMHMGSDN